MAADSELEFDEWFSNNKTEEFKLLFVAHRFRDVNTIAEISSNEELHAIGITLLGDKLFVMAKIKELKDHLNKTKKRQANDALVSSRQQKQTSMFIFSCIHVFY